MLILSTSGASSTDDSDLKRAGYTRLQRSLGGQVKEYAGTWTSGGAAESKGRADGQDSCDQPRHA
jgi:hypothetical protein